MFLVDLTDDERHLIIHAILEYRQHWEAMGTNQARPRSPEEIEYIDGRITVLESAMDKMLNIGPNA